ncbi:MAG: 2-phosphosulfolactate phosphatase [Elusimicrobiales bacterium]|nr:2-phosphosulfolactate phosphatase [Elusimicrobiales bacterium]
MSQKSPPPQSNKIRIAFDRAEAVTWRGRGIVIDLFRFSNTICALLESGRRDVRVYATPALALAARGRQKDSDLFSEIDMGPGVDQYDNSPYTALYGSDPSRPALSVTNSGSPAAASLLLAEEILVACFANFPALVSYCLAGPKPTLIVPACLFYDSRHVEDMICARALAEEMEGRDIFEQALQEIHSSGRVLDFIAGRPETGKRDMEMALKKGHMKTVPRIKFKAGAGIVDDAAKHKAKE